MRSPSLLCGEIEILSLVRTGALLLGRPREYDPPRLLPVRKPIWFAAFQPCGSRFQARLPWAREPKSLMAVISG